MYMFFLCHDVFVLLRFEPVACTVIVRSDPHLFDALRVLLCGWLALR